MCARAYARERGGEGERNPSTCIGNNDDRQGNTRSVNTKFANDRSDPSASMAPIDLDRLIVHASNRSGTS